MLKRGVKGYENTKLMTTQIRKRMGLKFDEIKFKKERSMRTDYGYSGRRTGGQTYRGGRVDISALQPIQERTLQRCELCRWVLCRLGLGVLRGLLMRDGTGVEV